MKRRWIFFLACVFGAHQAADAKTRACEGFLPRNDLRIEVGAKLAGGITKTQYNQVLDRIDGLFRAEFASLGGKLKIVRDWQEAEVNAYADREGNTWMILMHGGLARHPSVTLDGFALIACHEIGHHRGGAPKYHEGEMPSWASNEGESDYYATLKCLRRYFAKDDNEKILSRMKLDPVAVEGCQYLHQERSEQLLCIRSTMAGLSAAGLFSALSDGKKISLNNPDTSVVSRTYDPHPEAQCRLDTYFQGALCTVPVRQGLRDDDYRVGSCWKSEDHAWGLRPQCWFRP